MECTLGVYVRSQKVSKETDRKKHILKNRFFRSGNILCAKEGIGPRNKFKFQDLVKAPCRTDDNYLRYRSTRIQPMKCLALTWERSTQLHVLHLDVPSPKTNLSQPPNL